MYFSIYTVKIAPFALELEREKNENKQKDAGIGRFKKVKHELWQKSNSELAYVLLVLGHLVEADE